jgi:hypothetical protein
MMFTALMLDMEEKVQNEIKGLIGERYSFLSCYAFLHRFPHIEIILLYTEQGENKMFLRKYDPKIIGEMGYEEIAQMFFTEFVFGVRGDS